MSLGGRLIEILRSAISAGASAWPTPVNDGSIVSAPAGPARGQPIGRDHQFQLAARRQVLRAWGSRGQTSTAPQSVPERANFKTIPPSLALIH